MPNERPHRGAAALTSLSKAPSSKTAPLSTTAPSAHASPSTDSRRGLVSAAPSRPVPVGDTLPPEQTLEPVNANSKSRLPTTSRSHFLNRELTWLAFNRRVLHEAQDDRTLLLDRVKFLAIVASNLDEFVMKRIGGLKQQIGAGMTHLTVDGRTPKEQIEACYRAIHDIESQLQEEFFVLKATLKANGVEVLRYEELESQEQSLVRDTYLKNIFPLVTPQAVGPAHPFPFISNQSLNLLVSVRYPREEETSLARVKVPLGGGISRFVRIPGTTRFVLLEDVMAHNLDLLFPKMVVVSCELFRVTRNANTEREEETADDLLVMIEAELRDRKFAPIVRLEVEACMQEEHRVRLARALGLDSDQDVFAVRGMMAARGLHEIASLDLPQLKVAQHHPVPHARLIDAVSVFDAIKSHGSLLLHHPYESFAHSVVRFLREASDDPQVKAIKMTLYRTSADSKIIDCLADAARNGKQVAVVVELKARFDEAANIRWANQLEEYGIHVTYGLVGLKTHCKVILVVRQDYDGLRRYAHVGTGNYHAGTARMYDDLGLLTCDNGIGADLTELFNYLTTGFTPGRDYQKVLTGPKRLKKHLLQKIEREIKGHTPESPGHIQFKMNALEDADVTRALYRASQAGVRVELIVRDTCRLRPGVPGLSENVSVVSIVGRFLEHARLYYFRNGGAEEYYLGSADCMKRNLESRVELLVPVEDAGLRKELRVFLDLQLAEERLAWDMREDGSYVQRVPSSQSKNKGCHERFIERAERSYRAATRLKKRKTLAPTQPQPARDTSDG